MSESNRRDSARRGNQRSWRGCANCRQKHVKCDDTKPRCRRCVASGVECIREVRFKAHFPSRDSAGGSTRNADEDVNRQSPFQSGRIHQSDFSMSRASDIEPFPAHSTPIQQYDPRASSLAIATLGTSPVRSERSGGRLHSEQTFASGVTIPISPSSPLVVDSGVSVNFSPPPSLTDTDVAYSDSGMDTVLSTAHSSRDFGMQTITGHEPIQEAVEEETHVTSPQRRPDKEARDPTSAWPLTDPTEVELMRFFVDEVSRRFDICDSKRHFALVAPWRAAFCPPLLAAIFALSARCMSRTKGFDPYVSNRYFQRCLNDLIPLLDTSEALRNQDLFAAIVLLRTLEEIDIPIIGNESRTHLFGSHLFISASKEHLPPAHSLSPGTDVDRLLGLRRASALIAFRQEIYKAFVIHQPVEEAFRPTDIDLSLDVSAGDSTWTDRILIKLADALDFCFGPRINNSAHSTRTFEDIWEYSEEWYRKKPSSFDLVHVERPRCGGAEGHSCAECFAPARWILSETAVTGLVNFHLFRILMLSFDPGAPRLGPSRARYLAAQEKRIKQELTTLISLTKGNSQCAPLFAWAGLGIAMAGDRFKEPWEHEQLMDILKDAEVRHGWNTLATQRNLMQAWV